MARSGIAKDKDGRSFLNKRDIWLLGGILLLATIIYGAYYLWGSRKASVTAQITVDGKMVREVDLSRNETFSLEENPHVHFEVRDGAIAFTESDCPDKVCINTGYLNLPGQTAACLPNKVLVSVMGSDSPNAPYDEYEMDVIAQ